MKNKIIVKDMTVKVLSVVFAILLWFYVITEQNPIITKDITVPVKLLNIEYVEKNNMVLTSNPNALQVVLKLKGKTELLRKIDETTVTAYADLAGHKSQGDNYLQVELSGLPNELESYSKSSDSIVVNLERKINSQRQVEINIKGAPGEGLAAMNAIAVPADIVLLGAESKVNKVKTVRVDVDITAATIDVVKKLPVQLYDEAGKVITDIQIEPADKLIEITVPVANTKLVPIKLEVQGQPAEGYTESSMLVYPKEIMITGKPNELNNITFLKTETIDISGLTNDVNKKINVILPPGVEFTNKAEEIKADIRIEKIISKTITFTAVEFRNLDAQFTVENPVQNIQLVLKGPESLINDPLENIKLYVDLKRGTEGANTVDVMWEKPANIEIVDMTPPQIQLVLKKS